MKNLAFVSFVANEIRDVRAVVELSKKAYINVQNQKVFQLKEADNNKVNDKDVPTGRWAEGYVKALADNNISKGDGKGNFLCTK